jgi:hypothetical protein
VAEVIGLNSVAEEFLDLELNPLVLEVTLRMGELMH